MVKIRSSTWALVALFIAIAIVFSLTRVLAVVLFIAMLLSILLYPVVDKLSVRFKRGYAAALVLCGFIAIIITVASWIIANIVPGFANLVREIPSFVKQIKNLPNILPIPPEAAGYVDDALRDAANIAVEIVKNSADPLLRAVSGVVELIAIPVITFYFLKDGGKVSTYFTQFLQPQEALRINEILGKIRRVLGSYIRGQIVISVISATAVCLYFIVAGLPYALVFAAISAVAELAPVVGPAVASVFAAILAYSYSPLLAAKTLIFYIIMLKINHNLVYPALIGRATKLHPVAIVCGVLFFGHIFGVLGMMLAVPMLAVTKVVFEQYAGE